MPNYICFYLDSRKIKESSITDDVGDSFILDSKREIGIMEGDKFVTISKKGYEYYQFNEYGIIKNVEFLKESKEELKTYRISYTILNNLTENNLLPELQYSLIRVYNYKNPQKHFLFSYVYLDEIDFNTIVEGRLFVARTAFGKIINSLPPLHIQNFIINLITSQGLQFFNRRDYINALRDLRTYIVEEIENRGKLLLASEELLRENFKNLVTINDIGFLDSENKRSDNLVKQSSLFRNLFTKINEFDLWNLVESEIAESKNERFFNENFTKKEWPINYGEI